MAWLALLAFPAALVIWFVLDYCFTSWRPNNAVGLATVVVALIFGTVNGCGYKPALKASIKTKTLYVNHRERTGGDKGKWLVFTNHGVYSVEDSFWLFKFDASDRYNGLRVGHTYRCRIAGWRIHFTSDYPNLIGCKAAI